jgi:hypothetical protein
MFVKKVYRYYKERLVEISGRSRSLYSKRISKKYAYDIGRILDGDYEAIGKFIDFLWGGKGSCFSLISSGAKTRICKNLKVAQKIEKQFIDKRNMKQPQRVVEDESRARAARNEEKKTLIAQVNDLKILKREIEDFARETGRYELFIGYPFVEGSIGRDMIIRAPLFLFPVTIHIESESSVEIELKPNEHIQLNKVFILAYAKHFRLDIEAMELEFANLNKLKNIDAILNYLRNFGFKMGYSTRKGMFNFEKAKEPYLGDPIEIKHYAVMGRFPLANAIYNDYSLLEKRRPTQAIRELLDGRAGASKIKNPNLDLYSINSLDFAQEDAIRKLNQHGNMVIYGPPGTGKSQTIVNIITDAMCKGKRVLVVSQKKAALDVVYNRLGTLNDKAMYINDPEKGKGDFYSRTKTTHHDIFNQTENPRSNVHEAKYKYVKSAIDSEVDILQTISDTLWTPGAFGLTMQEMYAKSYQFGQDELEQLIYKSLQSNTKLMGYKYHELNNTIRIIKEKRKGELYYKHLQMLHDNPLIAHIKDNLDVNVINKVRSFISNLLRSRIIPFNFDQYPSTRQLLSLYLENGFTDPKQLKPIMRFIARIEKKNRREIEANFLSAMDSIKVYVNEYSLLESVLERKGFAITLENILNGNTMYLQLLHSALKDYVQIRDMNINLKLLTELDKTVLHFAYGITENIKDFGEVISRLIPARIYHELVEAEQRYKNQLSKIMEYESVKDRIVSLKKDQHEVVRNICMNTFRDSYMQKFNENPENKNFLYQITKAQNLWSIRKLMEIYGDLMLELFPCWLLSPENVSTIMPLRENYFDLILFDEASQIFIESTLPTIYRGKNIVIAGDNKQLRPTALFMRRYMGNDIDEMDLNTQAALEVESLLDLATSRYTGINLNYHYRSKHEEFINFSNHAFYDCKLQIAPNLSKNSKVKPIERIKVEGEWLDRKNKSEASAIISLLKKIFRNRKERESIGIITFNAEQEQYIKDLIDKEAKRDAVFGKSVLAEYNRKENGEDISLFTKNIENVQGDERDIIIFSIGYAKNEYGKIISHFGPLNQEGGENRLNVAVTRAKKKVYVVTSIEPEELNVENTKNIGPKIFKKYLQYVRAVASGSTKEVEYLLEGLKVHNVAPPAKMKGVAPQLKKALEQLGWSVEMNLGNTNYKLSLAIYDKTTDKFLLGVECDDAAYNSSTSVIERDVFRRKFLESRGWQIIRVWSRDWWLNQTKVVNQIDRAARKALEKNVDK